MSASTDLEALSLSDQLIAEIYANETSFRRWCNSNVFPAEVTCLLQSLLNQSERSPYEVLDVLRRVLPHAQALAGSDDAIAEINADQQIFVASANTAASSTAVLKKVTNCRPAEDTSSSGF